MKVLICDNYSCRCYKIFYTIYSGKRKFLPKQMIVNIIFLEIEKYLTHMKTINYGKKFFEILKKLSRKKKMNKQRFFSNK